jgi:hypothetical protein
MFPIWRPEVMLSDAKKVSNYGCVEQGRLTPVFFKISLKFQNCIAVLVCAPCLEEYTSLWRRAEIKYGGLKPEVKVYAKRYQIVQKFHRQPYYFLPRPYR